MKDRYTKTMATIAALSTLSIAISLFSHTSPVARAQSPTPKDKCTWTYINDGYAPNIGKDGKAELKGKNWQELSEGGWRLKAGIGATLVFERCE